MSGWRRGVGRGGQKERERENLKQTPCPVQSSMQGSVSQP